MKEMPASNNVTLSDEAISLILSLVEHEEEYVEDEIKSGSSLDYEMRELEERQATLKEIYEALCQ